MIPSRELRKLRRPHDEARYLDSDPSGRWKVGDEVVCIRNDLTTKPFQLSMERLTVGQKYSIRAFNIPEDGFLGFYLIGVHNDAYLFADDVVRELSYDQAGFERVS